jgi:predicted MPP superfamily phosphohydrolase
VSVPLSSQPGGRAIRLLHLSDLHASEFVPLSFIEEAAELGLAARPDVSCLTGDFVTGVLDNESEYRRVLRRLSDAAPVFACLGNHDGGAWSRRRGGYEDTAAIRSLLAGSGIQCLHNTAASVTIEGTPVTLIGLGDWWAGEADAVAAFASIPGDDGARRILLCHNPDAKEVTGSFRWDLMLCGHTHGGQVRIPFVGAPFAPVSDKRFVEGLQRWNDRWIHVTRGVGNLHGLRCNCRPEVSVLELA